MHECVCVPLSPLYPLSVLHAVLLEIPGSEGEDVAVKQSVILVCGNDNNGRACYCMLLADFTFFTGRRKFFPSAVVSLAKTR